LKRIFRYFIAGCFILLFIIFYTNLSVGIFAKGKTFSSVESLPKNRVGLLLGTSQYLRGGGINPFFQYRVEAAVELFNSGKIDFILVSGDNKHLSYNEPRDFKRALVQKGIPDEKIILDYAGFRTLDSVMRAQKVFGQDSITIISQKFHNQRAIYIARKNNMKAIGYNAKDPLNKPRVYLREYLAKTVAYFDVLFDKQPKFLGEKIKIE